MYQIAIDGPSGAGKSTVAKALAKELSCIYVDTGAMYRTIGLYVSRKCIDKDDSEAIKKCLADISISIAYKDGVQRMFLNGEDVTDYIRTQEISMYASKVSAIPEVRSFLIDLQRDFAKSDNVVMDGRDIGTVIFPGAAVKIFLVSSPKARAMRRFKELVQKGENVSYEEVLKATIERDNNDTTRKTAPAVAAPDAVTIDNSELGIKETLDAILMVVKEKIKDI